MLGAGSWTWRLDQVLHDAGLALVEHPGHPEIVIVAIDEPSLESLGRWPWPRGVHAGLLERIAADRPRSVGVDVAFTEAETRDPEGDRRLAVAAQGTPGLVLPVLIEGARETLPIPGLRTAARLSHVSVRLDADGVLRGIELRRISAQGGYDHMALAMLRAGARDAAASGVPPRLNVAFAGPPGHFPRLSAAAVLRGETPRGAFAGKFVLVGATAIGMGDNFATPSTVRGGPMPGVEVTANALDNLLGGRRVTIAAPWAVGAASALAALGLLLVFAFSGPRASLWAALATAVGAPLAAFAVLGAANFWFAPMTLVATALVAYPLWSWRRLEAAARYLDEELTRLREETGPMRERRREGTASGDFLRRRIAAMRAAVAMLRNARRFISDSLDGLPHAALIADLDGKIAIANRLADTLGDPAPCPGQPLAQALAQLQRQDGGDWPGLIDAAAAATSVTANAASADGREFLLRVGPFRDGAGDRAGLIVIAEDVTELRRAQREREETLSFVSHDLRSPQSSILALVELQRLPATRKPEAEFAAKIEQLAWKTVNLAEDFVYLTRADSKALALGPCDLADLAQACVRDLAPQAAARGIVVAVEAAGPVALPADRDLVARALANLLSNAIKYSRDGTRVRVSVESREGFGICTVHDQGVGMSEADRASLFKHFGRIDAVTRATRAKGIGLGLVFVETVARRHGGKVTVQSEPGRGSSFAISLPVDPGARASLGAIAAGR